MSSITINNKKWIYTKQPEQEVTPESYKLIESTDTIVLENDQILLEGIYFSVDPYFRIQQASTPSWQESYKLNTVQEGYTVAQVVQVHEPSVRHLKKGDFVLCYIGWQKYAVVSASSIERKLNPSDAPVEYALGVTGMPGKTAYFGFYDAATPKPSDTVVVTSAAGAVGMLVAQFAKINGCRVVGIAGGSAKREFMEKELKVDVAIDYKQHSTAQSMLEALKAACPNGIDIYFDNVGGYTTDAAMTLINTRARVIICGQITQYNGQLDNIEQGPRFLHRLIYTRATIQGILARDYSHRMGEMLPVIRKYLYVDFQFLKKS